MSKHLPLALVSHLSCAASLLAALAGCGSGKPAPSSALSTVATVQAADLTVELLSERPLAVGLNALSFRITRTASGAPVSGAALSVQPMMVMTAGHAHSAPVIGKPTESSEAGVYLAKVVFSMASGPEGTWSLKVTSAGEPAVNADLTELAVAATSLAQSFESPSTTDATKTDRYLVTLNFLETAKVGANPIAVTVHRKQDMMMFPPVTDLSIGMVPEMPSMGHGSSGNVAPTHSADGVYEGTVSLSMGGAWRITLTPTRGTTILATLTFDVTI